VEIAIWRMIISTEGEMEMTIMGGIAIKHEGITKKTADLREGQPATGTQTPLCL
jgi:hypothetical protein